MCTCAHHRSGAHGQLLLAHARIMICMLSLSLSLSLPAFSLPVIPSLCHYLPVSARLLSHVRSFSFNFSFALVLFSFPFLSLPLFHTLSRSLALACTGSSLHFLFFSLSLFLFLVILAGCLSGYPSPCFPFFHAPPPPISLSFAPSPPSLS